MATIDIGKLTFTHKGDYAGGTAYVVMMLFINGSLIVNINTGNLPTGTAHRIISQLVQAEYGMQSIFRICRSSGKVNSGASALEFGTLSSDFVLLTQILLHLQLQVLREMYLLRIITYKVIINGIHQLVLVFSFIF